ncbi:MAG TPA: RodZ domain-containing protein [Candidatus Limnocylindrales bacterium]|nr:RodZ domain-containing protein [Candidatus Limnocylindrales bacterium]
MKSFGKLLKEERELRGITLEEVADYTKVNLRYLKAIEEDDLKSLPAATFVRGFLKSYAKFIGLNPEETVFNFDQFVNSLSKDPQPPFLQTSPSSKKGTKAFSIFIAVLVPLLILILGYSFQVKGSIPFFSLFNSKRSLIREGFKKHELPGKNQDLTVKNQPEADHSILELALGSPPNPSSSSQQTQLSQKNEAPLKEEAVLARSHDSIRASSRNTSMESLQAGTTPSFKDARPTGSSAQTTDENSREKNASLNTQNNEKGTGTYLNMVGNSAGAVGSPTAAGEKNVNMTPTEKSPTSEGKEHSLEITFIEKAWVRIYADNEKVFEGILEPPTTRTWYAREKFAISAGNAGGLELKLDNQKLPPLGKRGEVVTGVTLPRITSLSGAVKNKPASNVLE